MSTVFKNIFPAELESLSQDQQQKLLEYVLSLKLSNKKVTSGKDLMSFSGAVFLIPIVLLSAGISAASVVF